MTQFNYLNLLPEIIIASTGILVILADLIMDRKGNFVSEIISIIGLVVALLFVGFHDSYAVFFKTALIGLSLMVILISSHHIRTRDIPRAEYFALILFAVVGMMIMVGSLDLVTV